MGIAERIRQLKGDMSIPQFARFIGEEKAQRLQDVLAGRQRTPEDMLTKIVITTGCDANWLLLGEVDKPASKVSPRQKALLDNYQHADEAGKKIIEATASAAAQPITRKGAAVTRSTSKKKAA